jgi:hypothetical protein
MTRGKQPLATCIACASRRATGWPEPSHPRGHRWYRLHGLHLRGRARLQRRRTGRAGESRDPGGEHLGCECRRPGARAARPPMIPSPPCRRDPASTQLGTRPLSPSRRRCSRWTISLKQSVSILVPGREDRHVPVAFDRGRPSDLLDRSQPVEADLLVDLEATRSRPTTGPMANTNARS